MSFGVSTKTALTKREDYIMTQVAVIHTAFEDSPRTVALVQTKEGMTLNEKLEYAYRWTQNIMDSWSLKMPMDGNDDVTVMGELHVDENGLEYEVLSHETKQKNWHGGIDTSENPKYAVSNAGANCPVSSLKQYLSK